MTDKCPYTFKSIPQSFILILFIDSLFVTLNKSIDFNSALNTHLHYPYNPFNNLQLSRKKLTRNSSNVITHLKLPILTQYLLYYNFQLYAIIIVLLQGIEWQ